MPHTRTLADIQTYVKQLQELHQKRIKHLENSRLIRDLDLAASFYSDDQITKEVMKLVGVDPKVFVDWSVAALSLNPFEWRLPLLSPSKNGKKAEEDEQAAFVENLAYGVSQLLDSTLMARGGESWRFYLAEQIVMGSYAFVPSMSAVGGQAFPSIRFYDPKTVLWLPGERGMRMVAQCYKERPDVIRDHIESHGGKVPLHLTENPKKHLSVVDFWEWRDGKVYNAFLVDNSLILPYEEQPGLDRISFFCGVVNSRGAEGSDTYLEATEFLGRSVLDPAIELVKASNMWRTLVFLKARRDIFPALMDTTQTGEGIVEEQDLAPNKRGLFHGRIGEDVKVVQTSTPSFDVQRVIEDYRQQMERATLPAALFGINTPTMASGLLEQGLRFNATMRFSRYEAVFKEVAEQTMNQFLRLFKNQEASLKGLKGNNPHRTIQQQWGLDGNFERDFAPEDVPERFFVVLWHEPARPIDKTTLQQQELAKWQEGMQSRRRTQENIGVKDPGGEDQRRDKERLEEHPINQANALREAAWKELQEARAELANLRNRRGTKPGTLANAEFKVAVKEAVFFDLDNALRGSVAQQSVPALQEQPGREAPQPNQPALPTPPPEVQPPQARGEGPQNRRLRNLPVKNPGEA